MLSAPGERGRDGEREREERGRERGGRICAEALCCLRLYAWSCLLL